MIKFYCDMCGAECPTGRGEEEPLKRSFFSADFNMDQAPIIGRKHRDLCESCYNKLLEIVDGADTGQIAPEQEEPENPENPSEGDQTEIVLESPLDAVTDPAEFHKAVNISIANAIISLFKSSTDVTAQATEEERAKCFRSIGDLIVFVSRVSSKGSTHAILYKAYPQAAMVLAILAGTPKGKIADFARECNSGITESRAIVALADYDKKTKRVRAAAEQKKLCAVTEMAIRGFVRGTRISGSIESPVHVYLDQVKSQRPVNRENLPHWMAGLTEDKLKMLLSRDAGERI